LQLQKLYPEKFVYYLLLPPVSEHLRIIKIGENSLRKPLGSCHSERSEESLFNPDRKDSMILLSTANNLRKRGAQGIILGCTELPLIFPPKQTFPVFNPLKIIAMALLKKGGDVYE